LKTGEFRSKLHKISADSIYLKNTQRLLDYYKLLQIIGEKLKMNSKETDLKEIAYKKAVFKQKDPEKGSSRIIGLDIGGANTKLASADGSIIELHYLPLWKNTRLPAVLKEISERLDPEKVAVVMTGELADCFEEKVQGIKFIKEAVDSAFGASEIAYVTNTGKFLQGAENLRELAAANWAASARFIGAELGDCIFVDMGSTTTDIIPVISGEHKAGLTDFERLLRSELVYSGILRTDLSALLNQVELDKGTARTASELFTTTADAYLLLGEIDESLYTCETADGAGKSRIEAMRRLARLVCADLSEITEKEILEIAAQVEKKQISNLVEALSELAERNGIKKIVAAGLGEFLIKKAVEILGPDFEFTSVSEHWGEEISKVFPAYAAARLLEVKN
jgi:(4-(4-[2-(gamma-L-glutamylamino)ethyl]phenoxymethyl)furan-2-yl)methanamine synthase